MPYLLYPADAKRGLPDGLWQDVLHKVTLETRSSARSV